MSLITCTKQCAHQKDGICTQDIATKIDQPRADLECAYFSSGAKKNAAPRV